MELHDLRYFVAVAEDLHFGRAAERLHMTQPVLSRQIQALEAELDVRLLQRTKRSVKLTIAGQTLFEEAKQILCHTEQAIQTTRRVARGEVGQLRLSFTASALRSFLPEMVRVFRDRYPGVQLIMNEHCTNDQVAALQNHQTDVGFLYLPVNEKWLTLKPIAEGNLAGCLTQKTSSSQSKTVNFECACQGSFYFASTSGRACIL